MTIKDAAVHVAITSTLSRPRHEVVALLKSTTNASFSERVEVSDKRGEAAYLRMTWPTQSRVAIEQYLHRNGVAVGGSLWTH